MQYYFERLRFHFIEHAVQQVWQDGNVTLTILDKLNSEVEGGLTEAEAEGLKERVRLLYSEADKLLRSRIPHDFPTGRGGIELWGYQNIKALAPHTYIHHEQPTQADFDRAFALPEGEVWAWNIVYTFTGPYYGVQSDLNGEAATRSIDLGTLDFVLESANVLKNFPGCELLADLTPDNIDLFTLEADECAKITQVLQERENEITEALTPLFAGGDLSRSAMDLVKAWRFPLASAACSGIAQFKQGKRSYVQEES